MSWKRISWWWSQRVFLAARESRIPITASIWGLALLILAAGCLFFGQLDCPLQEPQEPRYAEIARQMWTEGSWLVPVLHGQPYYDKPPLLYWLIMGCYQVFGVHDWAARLVPCLAGFLCVLVTYWWGLRTVGPRTALIGSFILCLSPRFLQMGRMVLMDSPLCLCVVTAWATGHLALIRWQERGAWPWWVTSALACGSGLLVKGPVALVLTLAPLIGWQLLHQPVASSWRQWCRWNALYLSVALAVAAPWFILVALRDPTFLSYFFWFHHVERFVTPFDHEEPFWFYLPLLLLGMLPWTLLLPGMLGWLASQSKRQVARRPAGLGFFLLAFTLSFGFFSVAGCKRPAYILLTMPPLALALGAYAQAYLPRRLGLAALTQHPATQAYRLALATLVLGLAGAIGTAVSGIIDWSTGWPLAMLAGIGLVSLHLLGRNSNGIPWAATGLTGFLVMFLAVHLVLPGYGDRFAYRDMVHSQAADPAVPVACYPRRYDSVSFYLQRNDVAEYDDLESLARALQSRSQTVLFFRPGKGMTLADLLRQLPSGLHFEPQGREGSLMGGTVTQLAD